MTYYTVKNWERFQHYKDRNPPWIKLHFEILASKDWVMLADASKLLMVVCMMIASRNKGTIPADPHYFKRVAYLDKLPNFKPLLECGFLEIPLADASTLQADARPETYSTETETEEDKKERKCRGTRFALQDPPSEWIQFCETQRPDLQSGIVFDGFKDYWLAKPGKEATKLDWFATWRNWVRNQKSTNGAANGKTKLDLIAEGVRRARAKREQESSAQAG